MSTVSITGTAFLDANGNSSKDTGETGIAGDTVTLKTTTGTTVATTTTDSSGNYSFSGVATGAYAVGFATPSGDIADSSSPLAVTVGTAAVSGQNAGFYKGATIAGFIYNATGTAQDGVVVNLMDSTGAIVATKTSAANGSFPHGVYEFDNVMPGTYTIQAVVAGAVTPQPAITTGAITSGQSKLGFNVTLVAAVASGSITGTVFLDANGNSSKDTGEAGIAGDTVTLKTTAGTTVATTTTDSSGNYSFSGVATGAYAVGFATPSGDIADSSSPLAVTVGTAAVSGQNAGFYKGATIAGFIYNATGTAQDGVVVNLMDSTGAIVATKTSAPNSSFPHGVYEFDNVMPGTYTIQAVVAGAVTPQPAITTGAITSGQSKLGFNVTLVAAVASGSIAGAAFLDANGNSSKDTGEAGIAGDTVTLKTTAGTTVATTTTDSSGNYSFSGVATGAYAVGFATPSGDIADSSSPLAVTVGTTAVSGQNAGFYKGATIAGFIYNASGIAQDGVIVNLMDSTGAIVATKTSAPNSSFPHGVYEFDNVKPGTYTLQAVVAGALNPQPAIATGAITSGQSKLGFNVTLVAAVASGSIAGAAFLDANGNGTQDTGETGIAGDTVTLKTTAGTTVATATTDSSGNYSFAALASGTYSVVFATPAGDTADAPTPLSVPVGSTAVIGQNAGFYQSAEVAGFVVADTTGSGVSQDVDGVTVQLVDPSGKVVGTSTSGPMFGFAHGVFDFRSVAPGSYALKTVVPGATTQVAPKSIALTSGQVLGGLTLGIPNPATEAGTSTASISGFAFNDANSDGLFDGQEQVIDGETVQLLDPTGDPIATTTTGRVNGIDGAYAFTGLTPGQYGVRFTPPAGTIATTSVLLPLGTLSAGANVTINAGSVPSSGTIDISGIAFDDSNKNGVLDAHEAGLAGVDVVLIDNAGTSSARAVKTLVTDAQGSYNFIGLAPGTYAVSVATPSGDGATTPTSFEAGALVLGTSATFNPGFAPNPSSATTPIPASTTLNIVLRGQSNAQYFIQYGMFDKLKADLQTMLGFDGIHQKVNIVGDFFQSNGVNTINSGTSVVGSWLTPIGGDYTQGWTATSLELGFLSDLAEKDAAFKAAPTAVVWLHNEADSLNTSLTAAEWESAARYEAGLVRGVLGQDASSVPYLFVNAIPFPSNANGSNSADQTPPITGTDQQIRIGMAALANDPTFNGLIAAQASDINQDSSMQGNSGIPNGPHMGLGDVTIVEQRLLASLADTFASSALPGSPLALAGGSVDDLGPQVASASEVAGQPNQLLITVQYNQATSLEALASTYARQGGGWTIRTSAATDSTLEASGTAAQIISPNQMLLTFDQPVPAKGSLFYAWGSGRLAVGIQPGEGNAIYDNNNLPIWTDPNGVAIAAASTALPGSISGFAFHDTNGNAKLDAGETDFPGVTVQLQDASGTTVATTTTAAADGSYTFAGVAAGLYTVIFPPISGLGISGVSGKQTIVLASGQNVTDIDGGFYNPGSILGVAFLDTAGTGQYAGTGGVNGEQVQLLDASGTVVATTTTSNTNAFNPGVDGIYSFSNLAPGSYSVHFTPPAGDVTSTPSVPVTLNSQFAFVNSALTSAPTGSIAGAAFLDANGNGIQDSGETGIAGVAVTLKSAAGAALATTTTDSSGAYGFTALAAGTDTVSFATPNGYSADASAPLSVTTGTTAVTGQSAGFYQPAEVVGFVERSSTGALLDGVSVNLIDSSGHIVETVTSGAWRSFTDGVFDFTNVKPGIYSVDAPVGAGTTTPVQIGTVTSGSLPGGYVVKIPDGTASISGTIFTDANGDGAQQNGESGLAGVNLVLIQDPGTSNATALATMVSDAQGHYDFSGLVAGNYAVVAATPLGLQGTSATNVAVSALADGQSATANVGFQTNPTPNAAPLPASTTLNIVLRGQSNATYFMQAGFLTKLQQDVEKLLGFDGVNQKINIVGDTGNPTDSTLYPGTGLTTDWLSQINGSYTNGWTANSQELGLLTDLARQSAAFKSAPTAILYLHNESDALSNPNLTVAQWQSAVQFEAGLVRGILGQSASTTPYQFVDAIPFVNIAGVPIDREDQANQSIRVGMYGFAADPEFNAGIVAQSSDVDMNHDGPNGGAHLNTGIDDTQLESRLAQSLAVTFAASARPGSAVALANGNLDDKGPQVVAAAAVAGNPHQLLITVAQDQANGFLALGATAAQGVGWSIRASALGATSTLEASGTAAQLVDPTHILLTFDQPIPPGGSLFYAWGAARLSTTSTSPGEGNAIYDTNNLPISVDPNGVAITGAASLPPGSISGMAFNDANANGTQDAGDGGLQGVSVRLTDPSGTAVATVTTDSSGDYRFYGLAAGNYTVGFAAPSGDALDTTATLSVAVGTSAVTGQNVGVYQGAQVAGFVTDPVSGADVDGITVNLLDPTGAVVATTTSGPLFGFPHGIFDFTGVKPGVYSLETQLPGGTTTSTPQAIGQLVSGQTLGGLTIKAPTAVAVTTGSITGTAFLDANGNGALDTGETGIAGDTVTLASATGTTVATTTTDSAGGYNFTGVATGAYAVGFTTPSGDTAENSSPLAVTVGANAVIGQNAAFFKGAAIAGFVNDASGTPEDGIVVNLMDGTGAIVATKTSGPNPYFPHGVYEFDNVKPGTYTLQAVIAGATNPQPTFATGSISSGQNKFGFNLSLVAASTASGSIAGTAFLDANANGTQDSGDSGITGVAVTLKSAAGTTVATTTTDGSGNYSFSSVATGNYTVGFATPAGDIADSAAPLAVTLGANGVTGQSAGFYKGAEIAGFVVDPSTNADVDGITVNLVDSTGSIVATTTSGPLFGFAHGVYDFKSIKSGNYTVQAVVPGAPIQKTPPTGLLTSGQSLANFNINLPKPGLVISGAVFNDPNLNGTQETGEVGIAGDVVTLQNTAGATVATTTTASDGTYNFNGLAAGAYTVSFAPLGGYIADSSAPLTVTLTSQDATSENAGFYHPATIAGFVFNDANADGTFGGNETALDGITINLINGAGVVVATTTSSPLFGFPHGVYEFNNVPAGTYTVEAFGTDAPPISTGPLTSGQNLFNFNLAVTDKAPVGAGSITGNVFIDNTGSTTLLAGDAGVAAATVTLLGATGTPLATVATDANGNYSFGNVGDGTYSVKVTPPKGYAANAPTTSLPVTVANGNAVTGVNEGFHSSVTIQGVAFTDTNATGQFQTGETLVNGVKVTLLNFDHDPVASTVTSTINGAPGSYSFTNVAPGTYTVRFDAPSGEVLTTPALNSLGALTAGQVVTLDSGMVSSAGTISLSGTIFNDTNGDGLQEAGETGRAGVTALLMKDAGTANATAVKTLITDADGGYAFTSLQPGNYSVAVATPAGLASTSPTNVSVGALTTGQSGKVNVGFVTNPTPAVPPVAPSKVLNIVLIGQSNAQNIANPAMSPGLLDSLKSQLEQLLGFDGVNQTVNILADFGKGNGDNTINSGTGLTTDWLSQINGSYTNGWSANSLELGYLSDLSQQAATFKGGSTAIVMLHNEADSNNPNLTLAEWESAVRFEAGLTRAVLGQTASSVPWLFVNAIPFPGGGAFQDSNEQTIRIGQAALSADPTFGGTVAAQASDITENEFGTPPLGGHLNLQDRQLVVSRLLQTLADTFASSALPGSPISLANGHIDDKGPQVISATTVAGKPNQVLITVKQDVATGFEALDAAAAAGVGWSIRNTATGTSSVLEASGTAVQIVDGTHLLVTFDQAIPAGGLLFYAYGQGLIAQPGQSGYGNAVYDTNSLPISVDPNGLSVTPPDTTPPVVSVTAPATTIQAATASGAAVTFGGAASDAVDGTDPVVFTDGTRVVTSGQVFGIGTHTIVASATDAAGNTGTATPFSFSVVDTTAPAVTASAVTASVQATSASGAVETFAVSVSDAVDGASDAITFREQLAGGSIKVVQSGDTFGIGSHTIVASATDRAGNTGSATFSFGVVDPSVPVVTASAAKPAVEATSASGAAETFTSSVSDLVDGSSDTIIYSEQLAGGAIKIVHSGDTFGVGTHTITASATDTEGKTGTATFDFSVVDTTAPGVTASANLSAVQATSSAGAVESFTGSVSDAVDGTSDRIVYTERLSGGVTKTVQSGDTFGIGTHTIVASATDAAGNTGNAAPFSFSVVDTTAPAVTASAVTASVQATSASGAVETFAASATDAVDGTSDAITFTEQLAGGATKVVQSGDTFGIGSHTILASATDAHGNKGVSKPFGFVVTPLPASSVQGVAEDGYIAGATVFADANGNGVLDAGEVFTTTDAKGDFTLVGGSGPLVLTGGTDITTGLKQTGTLQAPAGSSIVSPLTTIVRIVSVARGISATTANASVAASLGLPLGTNLTTLDAETGAMAGNAGATAVFAAQTQVANAFNLIAAAGGTLTSSAATTAIATTFTSGASVLTNATALSALATQAGVGAAAAASVGKIGSVANALIATAASSASSSASIVSMIAAVATVAQGAASTGLAQAVADPSTLAATTAAFTGNAFVQATTAAGGTLSAPSVTLIGNGGSVSGLQVALSGTVDLADASGTVQLYENGTAVGAPVAVSAQGTFATSLTLPGDGTYAITATKSSAAGTLGASNAVSFTVDSTPNQSLFGMLTHDVTSAGGSIYALYETILGRAPDSIGFETAVAAVQAGASLSDIAQGMLGSPDYASDYGASVRSDSGFVTQLYADGLHRQPESSGLQTWTKALGTGQLTRAQVALDIATSAESQGDLAATFQAGVFVPSAADASIARLYYGLLDRAPDAGGLQNAERAVAAGATPTQLTNGILRSPEYQTTAVGQGNLSYIEGLYQTALGRVGDAAGVQNWETALDGGALSRADVAAGFLSSSEFQADTAAETTDAYINQVYQVALGRSAEPGGLQGWETAIANGLSRAAFDQDVVGSAEFQANVTAPGQTAFVTALYEGALGRAAEAGGLATWQSQFATGASAASVALGIAESPEATAHLAPQIEAGFHVA